MTDTATTRQEQALVNETIESNNNDADTMNGSTTPKVAPAGGSKASATTPPIAKPAPQTIGTKPTLVEKPPMRFLIMDAPRQSNLAYYIREMKKHNVVHVVRVCEPTYIAGSELSNAGIQLHEMEFKDGTSPPKEVIIQWLNLVESTFYGNTKSSSPEGPCIAVHCVAGLGRAPQMVAIALIEFLKMDPVEAVSFLRSKRRGAINEKQLLYLSGYQRIKGASADGGCACTIL